MQQAAARQTYLGNLGGGRYVFLRAHDPAEAERIGRERYQGFKGLADPDMTVTVGELAAHRDDEKRGMQMLTAVIVGAIVFGVLVGLYMLARG